MNDDGDDDAVVDVYAVGFQEIVPLQVQKVLKVQDVERDARMWDEKILRCLNSVSARNGGRGRIRENNVRAVSWGVFDDICSRGVDSKRFYTRETNRDESRDWIFFGIRDGIYERKVRE